MDASVPSGLLPCRISGSDGRGKKTACAVPRRYTSIPTRTGQSDGHGLTTTRRRSSASLKVVPKRVSDFQSPGEDSWPSLPIICHLTAQQPTARTPQRIENHSTEREGRRRRQSCPESYDKNVRRNPPHGRFHETAAKVLAPLSHPPPREHCQSHSDVPRRQAAGHCSHTCPAHRAASPRPPPAASQRNRTLRSLATRARRRRRRRRRLRMSTRRAIAACPTRRTRGS